MRHFLVSPPGRGCAPKRFPADSFPLFRQPLLLRSSRAGTARAASWRHAGRPAAAQARLCRRAARGGDLMLGREQLFGNDDVRISACHPRRYRALPEFRRRRGGPYTGRAGGSGPVYRTLTAGPVLMWSIRAALFTSPTGFTEARCGAVETVAAVCQRPAGLMMTESPSGTSHERIP
jgi:hypothetical protein